VSKSRLSFESIRQFIGQCTIIAVELFGLASVIVILWQHFHGLLNSIVH